MKELVTENKDSEMCSLGGKEMELTNDSKKIEGS